MTRQEARDVLQMMCTDDWFWANEQVRGFVEEFPKFLSIAEEVFEEKYQMKHLNYREKYYEEFKKGLIKNEH